MADPLVRTRAGSSASVVEPNRVGQRIQEQDTLWRAYLAEYGEVDPVGRVSRSSSPDWRSSVALKVSELVDLPANWDSYNAHQIRAETGNFALQILVSFATAALPLPSVVPSPIGGIQFEWHTPDIDFEIHVGAPYDVEFLFEDRKSGEAFSDVLSDDMTALAEPFARLASHRVSESAS